MAYALTSAPAAPAAHAAPVLAYHTASAARVGLHVERRPREWVIELFPPRLLAEVKDAAVWATRLTPVLAAPVIVLLTLSDWESWERPAFLAAAAFVFPWPISFGGLVTMSLFFRATVRIEVLPAVVCLTVTGFRLCYETVIRRSEIAAVELRWHGVRLKRRHRQGGDWITFGSRAQQREICRLLGEAMGLPVRGVPPTS